MTSRHGLSTFLLLLAGCLTAFIGWASFRGFGIWDEGYYLLASRNPQDVGVHATSFHHYTAALYRLVGNDIAMFRVAGMGALALACLLLAHGFRSIGTDLSTRAVASQPFVGLASLVYAGALVYYGTFALATPSYNLLTAICLTAAAGSTLASLGAERAHGGARAMRWMFATGIALGIQFFAKATSFASMAAAVALLVLLWPSLRARSRLRLLGALALGVAAWMAVHFATFEAPSSFAAQVRLSLEYHSHLGAAERTDPFRYALDFLRLGKDMLLRTLPALIALVLAGIWLRMMSASVPTARVNLMSWLAIAAVAAFLAGAGYHLGGFTAIDHARLLVGVYLFWLVAVVLIAGIVAVFQGGRRPGGGDLLLFCFLAAIPLAGAYGTSNFIGYNLPLTLAPWFAALLLGCAFLEGSRIPLCAPMQVAAVAFAASQVVTAYLLTPYDAFAGIREQTRPVRLASGSSELLVDPPTALALARLNAAAESCGFRSGDAVLAFYQAPGLVFALDGRAPLSPYFAGWKNAHRAAGFLLQQMPADKARGAFVLTHLQPHETLPDLRTIGREFPRDYRLCGETVWPATAIMVRLWKPDQGQRPD